MVILETSFGVLSWNEATEALELKWIGTIGSEDYRNTLNSGLEILKQKGIQRWLGDARQLTGLSLEDERWSAEDFAIRMVAAGVQANCLNTSSRSTNKNDYQWHRNNNSGSNWFGNGLFQ